VTEDDFSFYESGSTMHGGSLKELDNMREQIFKLSNDVTKCRSDVLLLSEKLELLITSFERHEYYHSGE
jgi:hypothetical protein